MKEAMTDTFRAYAFWSAVVLIKTLLMAFLTARQRFSKNVFSNKEDAARPGAQVKFGDEDVERVRRNHLNDLENVLPFVLLGLLYSWTNPAPAVALWHFRLFGVSRLAHTLAYQLAIPQPARAASFGVGMAVCLSMAAQSVAYYW